MGTTSKGFRYPEGSDLVIAGDDAIQALADDVNAYATDVDDRTALRYGNGWNVASAGALTPDTPVTVGYANHQSAGGFSYDAGTGLFSYGGPERAFVIAAGYVAVFGVPADENLATLDIVIAGAVQVSTGQDGSRRAACSLTLPAVLGPGQTIGMRAQVSDAADQHDAYLRIMAV